MELLQFLDVKDFPKTHWSNSISWEMASYMHELVVKKTRDLVQIARFISFSYDEVTTLDQQSWGSIHAYVVDGATSNNVKIIFVDAMVLYVV
jgi:hypothetical protein